MAKIKLNTLIYDLPSDVYHSVKGTYSSTQLKDMLDDEELFFKKYVEKSIPRESNAAFDVGTYFHTGILEPHKLNEECVVYPGAVRRGAEYEAFKQEHVGKCIVSQVDKSKANILIEATRNSKVSMSYISAGQPEVSMFVKLYVTDQYIFASGLSGWRVLTPGGWSVGLEPPRADVLAALIVKVRADVLGDEYILDLKSTTGNAKAEHVIKQKISAFKYDLSASFYLDIFSAGTNRYIPNFIWTFASKDFRNCRSWVASPDNILIGRAKWSKAILKLARCISRGWVFDDSLEVIEPSFFEREYLPTKTKGE